jgi:hypothetical protein
MKKLFALLILGAVAALLVGSWFGSGQTNESTMPAKASTQMGSKEGALPPSAALKIDPKVSSAASSGNARPQRGVLPAQVSPLMSEYLAKKDWPALMTKLASAPETGETAYLRANMLESCATKTDDAPRATPRKSRDERRAAFLASLPMNHPGNDARTNAWDLANPLDICGPIRDVKTTRKEIADLYAKAKELNDPIANARDLNCEIFDSNNREKNPGTRGYEINESRAERVRAAIASRNPDAVRVGVGMLGNTYANGAFRLAGEGSNVNQTAMFHVANLLACQYGADCSGFVHSACYREGKCNANSYEDYLAFYALSPNDAQTVETYRQRLTQMIDANDLSGLQLVMGEQPTDSVRGGSYFVCTP